MAFSDRFLFAKNPTPTFELSCWALYKGKVYKSIEKVLKWCDSFNSSTPDCKEMGNKLQTAYWIIIQFECLLASNNARANGSHKSNGKNCKLRDRIEQLPFQIWYHQCTLVSNREYHINKYIVCNNEQFSLL